jgi:hypothetical protein
MVGPDTISIGRTNAGGVPLGSELVAPSGA